MEKGLICPPQRIRLWRKGALEKFSKKHKKRNNQQDFITKALEKKLKKKDSLIAEIIEENIQLKKNTIGGI